MDLNVKIIISPSDEIPKKFSSDILEKMRNIVNTSLSKYVTLQSREMTVWYGPKRSKDLDKYYLFDIFLYNSSDTIEYSMAVTEIRAFFNNLKTHKSIALSNDVEIGIVIEFNHRLEPRHRKYNDISIPGDGSLRPLMGKTLELHDHRPNMFISNVNWCYRVPFDMLDEVMMIGIEAYVIKPADVTVYQHQYDKTYEFIYLCLDLFISHIDDGKTYSDITNGDKIRPKTYTEDHNVPVSVVIVAVVMGLLLVTAFCRIYYGSKKQNVQSGVKESPDVGIVSDTGMSEDQEPCRDQSDIDAAGCDKDINETNSN